MGSINNFILTLDIDWAPDFLIDDIAQILLENKVKATWFVTHQSEAIERLKEHKDLFELGIHPNMLAGSTHGQTEEKVLSYVKKIVPDAVSMRTHGLYQTSNFLVKAAKEFGMLIDVSLFLPRAANLYPHKVKWHGSSLWRMPYFWADDSEVFEDYPIWNISDDRLNVNGLVVFDFHPINIALNTESFERYDRLRKIRPIEKWDKDFIDEFANKGIGPRNLFFDLVYQLSGKGKQIQEIVNDVEEI